MRLPPRTRARSKRKRSKRSNQRSSNQQLLSKQLQNRKPSLRASEYNIISIIMANPKYAFNGAFSFGSSNRSGFEF